MRIAWFLILSSALPAQLRIDAGSSTDRFFQGGSAYTYPSAPATFPTMRFGASFAYNIPLSPGDYTVTLSFVERIVTAAGQHAFNVSMNGTQVLQNFDVFATAGASPVVKTFPVTISSAPLVLQFSTVVRNAIVNRIDVTPVPKPPSPPAISFTPFDLIRTSSTVLTLNSGCASSTPCNVRIGGTASRYVAPSTLTLTGSGTGAAVAYIDPSGQLAVASDLAVSCSGPCVFLNSVPSFPVNSIPLWTWLATNGAWDPAGTDWRATLSRENITTGVGLMAANSGGGVQLSLDFAFTPLVLSGLIGARPASCPGTGLVFYAVKGANELYWCMSPGPWIAIAQWTPVGQVHEYGALKNGICAAQDATGLRLAGPDVVATLSGVVEGGVISEGARCFR